MTKRVPVLQLMVGRNQLVMQSRPPILRPTRCILTLHRQSFLVISVQVQPDIILLALYLSCSQALLCSFRSLPGPTRRTYVPRTVVLTPTASASGLKQAKRASTPSNRVRREWRIVQVQISARSNAPALVVILAKHVWVP
jgi:hypothetical protein